jgi:hypothetical protein
MSDDPSVNLQESDAAGAERERVSRQNIDEFERLCDRVGAEAKARGMTEEILNQILSDEPTEEEAAHNRVRAQELLAVVAKARNRSSH